MKFRKQYIPLFCWLLFNGANAKTLASSFPQDLLTAVLPSGQEAHLSYLAEGFSVPSGAYNVDVYLNKQLLKRKTFEFRPHNDKLEPVLNKKVLQTWGVKIDEIDSLKTLSDNDEIFPLRSVLPESKTEFDGPNLVLTVQIPQLYLKSFRSKRDVAPTELWDDGMTAGVVNYSLTASHYDNRHYSKTYNQFANLWLDGHFNLGAWRLLTNGSFSYTRTSFSGQARDSQDWDLWNTYLQRDLPKLHSTLRMGEINTSGQIFDSFSMRGISLATNEQMLPFAERDFIPTISGYANSFAQVFIKQNDRIVYQMNVSPGPWKLDQFLPINNEGDLTVITREADGTERVEVISYAAVPMMLREGQFRYDMHIGEYYRRREDSSDLIDPKFGQITAFYGLPWNATLMGGALLSQDYQAYALGSAFSLGRMGALSFDIIHSHLNAVLDTKSKSLSGSSYRVRYEKYLSSTDTNLHLASYRYLTDSYRSFADLHGSVDEEFFDKARMKQRWQFSLTQQLGDWGQLSANGNYISYHDSKRANKTYSISYSNTIKGVAVRFNYSRLYERSDDGWKPDERFMLNLDVPLSRFISERTHPLKHLQTSYQLATNRTDGNRDHSQSVILRYNNPESDWYWRLSQVLGEHSNREASAMIGYDGDRVQSSFTFTQSDSKNTYMVSAAGGVLIHSSGVTPMARGFDSVALIEVEDVAGVKVNQLADVLTDSKGHAVVTLLQNYMGNEIVIDPSTLPDGALLASGTNQMIYPTGKSIIKVVYPVRLGYQALIYLSRDDGSPLPFGTLVALEENNKTVAEVMSFVGENGRTYFSGIPKQGRLVAKWKDSRGEHVEYFSYCLPNVENSAKDKEFVKIPQIYLGTSGIRKAE